VHGAWRRFAAHAFGGYRWSTKEMKLHHQENVEMEVKNAAAYAVEKGILFYFAK